MTTEESRLRSIVARIIDTRRNQTLLAPTWVATEALSEIDPSGSSAELVRLGCHLQLRQIARALCRKQFENPEESGDEPMFSCVDGLQWRYPTARSKADQEHEYILLKHMTDVDIAYNVARLRGESRAKAAHADTLELYGKNRALVA